MTQIRVEYDDDLMDVVDRVDAALRRYGLALVEDGLPHDGYCVLELRVLPGTCSTCGRSGCRPQEHAGWDPTTDPQR